jgi:hypothetical protein
MPAEDIRVRDHSEQTTVRQAPGRNPDAVRTLQVNKHKVGTVSFPILKPMVSRDNHASISFRRSKSSSLGIGSLSFKILVSDHQIERS